MSSKPFLKWAGGKHKLVPFLTSHLPQQRSGRLIEPFAGSAALTLATDYDAYLINDTNPDLITLYTILKQEKQGFIDYARHYFIPDNNEENRYYALREQFNDSHEPAERAALFIYLNRHAFNGLCRYNSKGGYNVPFGRYRAPYFPEKEMQAYLGKAGRIELSCGDFRDALAEATDDDTIYCDPPYVPHHRPAHTRHPHLQPRHRLHPCPLPRCPSHYRPRPAQYRRKWRQPTKSWGNPRHLCSLKLSPSPKKRQPTAI